MTHYRDLLSADGSLNRVAFEIIAANNLTYEINLALCVDSGLRCPDRLAYRDVWPWYAAQAAKIDPLLLSDRARAEIENQVRDDLRRLVRSMQRWPIEQPETVA